MSNNTHENDTCLLCEEWKEERSLVCRKCFQIWLKLWEKDRTPLIIWVSKQAEICCKSIAGDLEKAKNTLNDFKESIKQEAYDSVMKALRGAYVPHDDLSTMLETERQKVWEEKQGDKLYGHLKRTEHRAEKLPGFLKELKAKIEQYEKEQKKEQEKEQ